ncbi:MAG TPA: bifunctional phosphopantothenoylcysteine decarboxylase/phosphopantothenate--cysteine ligase CoaBC [Gaiellaceae bacterium]|nr:bifunctional phosphopantothenoylcysteine decarboxylase/phosphopantothenate--cysteine ligase CoaBC [Gaiellaceae bacterium]
MARVLLGVTGGIAAYKACELCRLLVRAGHEVTPVMTPDAERFVTAHTFEALARREAPRDLYPHLVEADLLVVAPLSANTLAKLAHGLADNVLTQLALAFRGPVLAAPAMNVRMWEHPATQENAAAVAGRGVELLGPATGELAEGEHGPGRMVEPEEIFARCQALLPKPGANVRLRGKTFVVSAGGTREPLDLVRFIGNRSSGRMGVALAAEARRRGADVTLVYANGVASVPAGVEVVPAASAADLGREMLARADADVVVMAAAVSDYTPRKPEDGKRPKDREPWTITLDPTEDVLAELGRRKGDGQVLVGFAAEAGAGGLERARAKLANKNGNLFVYNDVSQPGVGFESEDNEIVLLSARGERKLGRRSKEECAVAILDEVEALLDV